MTLTAAAGSLLQLEAANIIEKYGGAAAARSLYDQLCGVGVGQPR
jgi:hypothetical protein